MKAELIAAATRARAEEVRFVTSLTPKQRAEAGTHQQWSPRYLMAHVAAAKRRLVRAIDGELASLRHDEQDVYAAHADDAWTDVDAECAAVAATLEARIRELSDSTLSDELAFAWLGGRSMATLVAGYTVRHPLGHLADFYNDRGDAELAGRVHAVTEVILATLPADVAYPED